jgi:homoserine kinase type II
MLTDFKTLLNKWHIEFKRPRNDIPIPGSPERCLFRIVIEDETGRLFLLENIDVCKRELKRNIIRYLDILLDNGLARIVTYLKNDSGSPILCLENRWWQLMPYIHGAELIRPDYVFDQWRGQCMADFLIALRRKSADFEIRPDADVFSITDYIYALMDTIKVHAPSVFSKLEPFVAYLEKRFVTAHDRMPVRFCHGDFHPLNIIWGQDDILAVIDWEFTGFKAEIYDVANLIGCIGVEDPQALQGRLVIDFIRLMKDKGELSPLSWDYLLEFIIAIRFAWMSEWLRKDDREMITLEAVYMRLLLENRQYLMGLWHI